MNDIYFGTFGAESYWRNPLEANLPQPGMVVDHGAASMDEVLLPLCGTQDFLCTRCHIPEVVQTYHDSVGLVCRRQTCMPPEGDGTVCSLLLGSANRAWITAAVHEGYRLRPYAILPQTVALQREFDPIRCLPDVSTVQRVNSKIWSHRLRERLGYALGKVADSAENFGALGLELIQEGPFIVKQPHGVSGSGSLVIETEGRLQRVTQHLLLQEQNGFVVQLVLEPYLEKLFDFSAQLEVEQGGEGRLICLHGMTNRATVHSSSHPLNKEQETIVEKFGYEGFAREVAAALWADGDFGPAGIDAMVLPGGRVVPMLEVNARITLGLVNHRLDEKMRGMGLRSFLTHIRVRDGRLNTSDILNRLRREKLLFHPNGCLDGVLPLTANPSRNSGRLFVSVPYFEMREIANRLDRATSVINQANEGAAELRQLL